MTVEIRARWTIVKSGLTARSGHKILDEAAMDRKSGGPLFPDLSPDVRKSYEILSITRTLDLYHVRSAGKPRLIPPRRLPRPPPAD